MSHLQGLSRVNLGWDPPRVQEKSPGTPAKSLGVLSCPLFTRSLGKSGRVSVDDVTAHGRVQGPVVRKPINPNSGLRFILGFLFFCSKAFSRIIFTIRYRASIHYIQAKRIKLSLIFKLSYLNLYFALTLGYLNPALNNPAQD